jgi:hypothetical protein
MRGHPNLRLEEANVLPMSMPIVLPMCVPAALPNPLPARASRGEGEELQRLSSQEASLKNIEYVLSFTALMGVGRRDTTRTTNELKQNRTLRCW